MHAMAEYWHAIIIWYWSFLFFVEFTVFSLFIFIYMYLNSHKKLNSQLVICKFNFTVDDVWKQIVAFHWKYRYNVSLHHCMRTKGGSGHVILRAAPGMLFSVRLRTCYSLCDSMREMWLSVYLLFLIVQLYEKLL